MFLTSHGFKSGEISCVSLGYLFCRLKIESFFSAVFRSSHWRCYVRKGVIRNFAKFTGKHKCQSLFLITLQARPATLLKKRLAHVFSCEFCEISKNTFFTEISGRLLLCFDFDTSLWFSCHSTLKKNL